MKRTPFSPKAPARIRLGVEALEERSLLSCGGLDVGDRWATAVPTNVGISSTSYSLVQHLGNGAWGSRDVDLYRFWANAGETLAARTTYPAGCENMDTMLRLFDPSLPPSSSEIAYNDDDFADPSHPYYSTLDYTFAHAGYYYLGVSGYPNRSYNPTVEGSASPSSYSAGDYRLQLTLPLFIDIPIYHAPLRFPPDDIWSGPEDLLTIDLNWDFVLDVVVTNPALNRVSIGVGLGDGTFASAGTYGLGGGPMTALSGDFNMNGWPDVLIALSEEPGLVLLPDPALRGWDPSWVDGGPGLPGPGPVDLVVADFNQDGVPDAAVSRYNSSQVNVLLGRGDGTFGLPLSMPVEGGSGALAVGDFDGNGTPDLVVASPDSRTVSLLPGDGRSSFGSARSFRSPHPWPWALAAADVNNDGNLDLVVDHGGEQGVVSVMLGTGSGSFLMLDPYDDWCGTRPRPWPWPAPWQLALADLNYDGNLDVAVPDLVGGRVCVGLGTGTGVFRAGGHHDVGPGPNAIVTGDFNNDYWPDLMAASSQTGEVSVLLSLGIGAAAPAGFIGLSGAGVTATADLVTVLLRPGEASTLPERTRTVVPSLGDDPVNPSDLTEGPGANPAAANAPPAFDGGPEPSDGWQGEDVFKAIPKAL